MCVYVCACLHHAYASSPPPSHTHTHTHTHSKITPHTHLHDTGGGRREHSPRADRAVHAGHPPLLPPPLRPPPARGRHHLPTVRERPSHTKYDRPSAPIPSTHTHTHNTASIHTQHTSARTPFLCRRIYLSGHWHGCGLILLGIAVAMAPTVHAAFWEGQRDIGEPRGNRQAAREQEWKRI
jgi:hypothetical protein